MHFVLMVYIFISHFTNCCDASETCTSETLELLLLASRTSPLDRILFSKLELAIKNLQSVVKVNFPRSRFGLATFRNEPSYTLEQPLTFSSEAFSKIEEPCVDSALEALASAISDSSIGWGPQENTRKVIILFLPNEISADPVVCSIPQNEVATRKVWDSLKESDVTLIIISSLGIPETVLDQWAYHLQFRNIDFAEIELDYKNLNAIHFEQLSEFIPKSRCDSASEDRFEENSLDDRVEESEIEAQIEGPLLEIESQEEQVPEEPPLERQSLENTPPEEPILEGPAEVEVPHLEGRTEGPSVEGRLLDEKLVPGEQEMEGAGLDTAPLENRTEEPSLIEDRLDEPVLGLPIEDEFEESPPEEQQLEQPPLEPSNERCETTTPMNTKLQISMVVDQTGTFQGFFKIFAKISKRLIEEFKESHPGSEFALSLFCDYKWANLAADKMNNCYHLRQPFTTNSSQFAKAVSKVRPCAGGDDDPEGALSGIFFAIMEKRVGWKSEDYDESDNSKIEKIIIFFTDQTTHDDSAAGKFTDAESRHYAIGDGNDNCLNAFPPSFQLVGEMLLEHNVKLFGFVAKRVHQYWHDKMKHEMGIEKPFLYLLDLKNVERLGKDISSAVETSICDGLEYEDPPAYNTLGY